MEAGGVTASVTNCFCTRHMGTVNSPSLSALLSIDSLKEEMKLCNEAVLLVKTADDIVRAKEEGKIAVIIHFEGGEPVNDDLGFLRTFHALGLRSMGLTHNYRNEIADSVEERSGSGLSNFGVDLIHEMDRLGIVIDVSHLSKEGFWDVIQIAENPVIASHCNARSLCDHKRNLNDEQIRAIADKGGIVGACFYGPFISHSANNHTIEKLLDHIEFMVNLVGIDHVGLGPDFIDYLFEFPQFKEKYSLTYPKGLKNTTQMFNVTRGLVSRGYTNNEIEKILGKNLLRVFDEVI